MDYGALIEAFFILSRLLVHVISHKLKLHFLNRIVEREVDEKYVEQDIDLHAFCEVYE
tara:strand:- start:200 stop:373 length:174 start_codon:yes stop_codon:yes gene_type:complete